MQSKKLVIHIIDSLGRGGAEILLKNTLNLLQELNHLVLYLSKPDDLKPLFNGNIEFINLNHSSWKDSLSTIRKIRRVIIKQQPFVVHSHLFYSTFLTRLAVPANVPLVSSVHSLYSMDAFIKNKKSIWAERLISKRKHAVIGVSKAVLDDYVKSVNFRGKTYVLHNFLPNEYFDERKNSIDIKGLKCIAVGNLKEAKNYQYLLKVFALIKEYNISLDIYGDGYLKEEIQQGIDNNQVKVKLCGVSTNIKESLGSYNLFIQASEHEGFGISVIEAMASGMPVFISDIPVFREITHGLAHFFPLNSTYETAKRLIFLQQNPEKLNEHIQRAYEYVCDNYSEKIYKRRLMEIYKSIV